MLFRFGYKQIRQRYLLRQYFYSNLHDRLSTRPFLSQIEKKWLAFQVSPPFIFVVVGWSLIFTKVNESNLLVTVGSCIVSLLSVAINLVFQISGTCKSHSSFFSFPDMVVDLAHLVVQLIHAVEQSHSKGVCHGEKSLSELHWQ